MRAMILAAGLGTRMAPLSTRRPKAALPVLDEPLVVGLVRALAREGVGECVVNTHAHAEAMHAALAGGPIPVRFSHEPALLGSGGGIAAARDFLAGGPGPFLVLNADMSLSLGLRELCATHQRARRRGALVTLALRDEVRKQLFGSLGYDARGFVRRITQLVDRGGEVGSGLFAGIQLMEPGIFERFPARPTFDIVRDVYVPLLAHEDSALAVHAMPPAERWEPVGTPRELLDVNLAALERMPGRARTDASAHIEGRVEPPVFVGAHARVTKGACVGPRVVLGERALVAPDTRLSDALVLPGARPPAGARLSRAICFDDEVWQDA